MKTNPSLNAIFARLRESEKMNLFPVSGYAMLQCTNSTSLYPVLGSNVDSLAPNISMLFIVRPNARSTLPPTPFLVNMTNFRYSKPSALADFHTLSSSLGAYPSTSAIQAQYPPWAGS